MSILFANNTLTTLASDITAIATSLTVASGTGSRFPSPTGGDYFHVTVENSSGVCEVMHCTARTNDVLTVTRAQESTTATAFSAGAVVECRPTKGAMEALAQTAVVAANYQPLDATLTALAGVTTAADKLVYATDADTFGTTDLTATARTLLDDTSTTAMRTTLGLGDAATATIGVGVQAYDADTVKSDVTTGYTAQQYPVPVAVTSSSGALAIDCNLHAIATITLSENTTVSAATNQAAGKLVELIVTGASTYTLSWNTNWKMADGTTISTTPAAGKKTRILAESDGTYMQIYKIIQEA